MLQPRIIPVLLINGRRLLKGRQFKDHRYVGDPTNAVRIFNDKEVDELIILDIGASERGGPDYHLLEEIVSEAFMPVCYGGGVSGIADMERIFRIGVEKISLGRAAAQEGFINSAARTFGSQSVVACVDYSSNWLGRAHVVVDRGRVKTGIAPADYALRCVQEGAGEILLQSVDRDGTRGGFDMDMIQAISRRVSVPLIACGGCSGTQDMRNVIHKGGASAAAAGSLFVFQGKFEAVLISYPSQAELQEISQPYLQT